MSNRDKPANVQTTNRDPNSITHNPNVVIVLVLMGAILVLLAIKYVLTSFPLFILR